MGNVVCMTAYFLCFQHFILHNRITWEQKTDVGRSLRTRASATRMPGGIPASDLDSAMKSMSFL